MSVYVKCICLSILSGILLWLGFPPHLSFYFLFIGLIPFLFVEEFGSKRLKFYEYCFIIYIGLFTWNFLTTIWLYKTTFIAALLVHLLNPIILSIPFIFYRLIRTKLNRSISYFGLLSSWIFIEYSHFNWELAFPFFTLGNGLSTNPMFIQWYEFSGVLGGSIWILVTNILIYETIRNWTVSNKRWLFISTCLIVIILPSFLSIKMFQDYEEDSNKVSLVIIHPEINNYNEKYIVEPEILVNKYLALTSREINQETDYVVWPETAISDAGWISDMQYTKYFNVIRNYFSDYEKAYLISGFIGYELAKNKYNSDINYSEDLGVWFSTYNGAFQYSASSPTIYLRTKSKLVPFEERIPYPDRLNFLKKIIKSLGGFKFTVREYNNNIFYTTEGVGITPLICYESIFGEATTGFSNNGANLFIVLLNEGWYKDYRAASQFMYFSALRAIENRRSIARSSNGGISCIINQKGEVSKMTYSNTPSVIASKVSLNKRKTFYSINGDYLGKICSYILIFLVAYFLIRKFVL